MPVNHRQGDQVRIHMRLRRQSKIGGATRSLLGHPQCGSTQEREKGGADAQAHKNRWLDSSFMDNRNHSICHFCPGVQTSSFAVIIPPEREGSDPSRESSADKLRLCSAGRQRLPAPVRFDPLRIEWPPAGEAAPANPYPVITLVHTIGYAT